MNVQTPFSSFQKWDPSLQFLNFLDLPLQNITIYAKLKTITSSCKKTF